MHHYRFNPAVFAVYAITAAAVVLWIWTAAKALTGQIRYPDHLFFESLALLLLCWLTTGPRELVVLRKIFRFTRQKAASAYSYSGRIVTSVSRAVRGLSALFTFPSHPQTEP